EPGMARPAARFDIETGNGVAAGYHAPIAASRLRHKDIFVARGFRLDQAARRGAADLLVTGEQYRDRQRGRDRSALQLAHRLQRKIVAALHVEHARPVAALALLPPGEAVDRAQRMHRVEMAEDQDTRLARSIVGKDAFHAIAEAHMARNALDL